MRSTRSATWLQRPVEFENVLGAEVGVGHDPVHEIADGVGDVVEAMAELGNPV